MLGEGAVALFALKALGWGAKRISLETGVSRNTVRDWLRAGESRRYGGTEGPPADHYPRHSLHQGRSAKLLSCTGTWWCVSGPSCPPQTHERA